MALTGLVIDDIDNNGQADMLVMVQDGEVYFTNQDDEYGKIYRMKRKP